MVGDKLTFKHTGTGMDRKPSAELVNFVYVSFQCKAPLFSVCTQPTAGQWGGRAEPFGKLGP